MNSTVNSLSYAPSSIGGGIEPAMHIINSLGLPNNNMSSASFFSSSKPANTGSLTAEDMKVSNHNSYRPPLDFLDSLKYKTEYTPHTYRPSSLYDFSSPNSKSDVKTIVPTGRGPTRSYSYINQSGNKSGRSGGSNDSFFDPDENNNFLRDQRGRFAQCAERVSDGDPSDRTCQLAQPKRLPCEYQEDRRSVYCSCTRMRPNCGNHTHFETTARLDELAMPKAVKDDCFSCRQSPCDMICYYRPHVCTDDEMKPIDWGRLAVPKQRQQPNFRPLQHVRKSALKAAPTKRLCKLSVPKPVIDVAKFYLWLWSKKPDTKVELKKVERLFITKCQMADMRVMIRCDLDPCTGGGIESKLAAVVPTIKYAINKGAKSVIIVSSRGPPVCTGSTDRQDASLKPLAERFEELLGTSVLFLDDCVGYQARALCRDPEPGNVFLLENLAFHFEETGRSRTEGGQEIIHPKEKIEAFRSEFFNLSDTYIIDSFRELVSMTNTTIGYPNQQKAYGFKVKSELDCYNSFIYKPRHPMVAIVGGTLKETFLIIRNLMGIATDIVIGGEAALTFLRALKRTDLGVTHITPKMERKALSLHSRAKDTNTGLLLPSDVVVKRLGTEEYFTVLTRDDVDEDYEIVDIGPFTRKCYTRVIEKAVTLLWWGAMGSINDGTEAVAAAFVRAAQRGARTYVADAGTKAAINNTEMGKKTHVTEDSVATTMMLRGKLPKGLASLNPPRRKMKKFEPAAPPISSKPIKYDIPGMEISSGDKLMCISDVDIDGKNVIIRVDFHVPMQGNKILNNYRIRMVVPTIKYALKWRARTVVIMGHLGFPDGRRDDSLTLKPICDELASLLGHTVMFVPETVGKLAETAISNAHPGTVIVLENVRFYVDDTGSGTSSGLMWKPTRTEATPLSLAVFCEKLTRLGDVFVNDAFSCLNNDHSSIMGYYLRTRVCGFLVKNELKYLARMCNLPQRRLLVILGGNAFKSKIPILMDLLKEADDIILVGALAIAFLKVYLGIPIGLSMYDSAYEQDIRNIIDLSEYYSCTLFYPVDLIIASNKNGDNSKQISITEHIPDTYMVIDIGSLTSSMYSRIIKKSKMVFWVGTAGIAEVEAGVKGTKAIMDAVTEVTKDPENGIISILGGRSTSEFIYRLNAEPDSFTHVTTGSEAAFRILTERKLLAMDNLMPKPSTRPIRVLGVEQVDVSDKRVLVRADLDVPIVDGKVVDTFNLYQLAATVKYLLKRNARSVVLVGDRGQPDGMVNLDFSLLPVKAALERLIEQEVFFVEEGVSDAAEAASKSKKVVLLENMNFHPEEAAVKLGPKNIKIKVSYDVMDTFRALLTSFGDIYVNESLSTLHLNSSSVVGLGNIRKVAGISLRKTLLKFEEIKKSMERPLLAILGGDNPLEDIPSLYKLLDLVDEVIVCGALAQTILKAETSANLGKTSVSLAGIKLLPRVIRKAKMNKVNIHLPVDYIAEEDPSEKDEGIAEIEPENEGEETDVVKEEKQKLFAVSAGIPADLIALDIGPQTIAIFNDVISEAKTIILHGLVSPYYMSEGYQAGSTAVLEAIEKATANGCQSVAIGMKAGTCLSKLDAVDSFTLYANGVQVFYDMLRGLPLPGMKVLEETPAKPLKKLTIDQMDLANKRVLMRLDLFVPTVEGVVLDTDKLELAAPTITLALKRGAKCVVIMGHRGNPNGYKNTYLSMEPLVVDFCQILEIPVILIDRPCSKKAKTLLADPPPGSVFLMENLKFYPAEQGQDALPRESKSRKIEPEIPLETGEGTEEKPSVEESMPVIEKEESVSASTPSAETMSDGDGGKNIDSLMFQLMTPKTVAEFTSDLAACGDVFVNDDVADVADTLTSLQGFGLSQKGCGLLLAAYISDLDDPEVYNLPAIESLSPSPFK